MKKIFLPSLIILLLSFSLTSWSTATSPEESPKSRELKPLNSFDLGIAMHNTKFKILNDHIYVASRDGLKVLKLDEQNISEKWEYNYEFFENEELYDTHYPGEISDIQIENNFLYTLGSRSFGRDNYFMIFEINNTGKPNFVNEIELNNQNYPSDTSKVQILGNYAYILGSEEIEIFNITDKKNITKVHTYTPNRSIQYWRGLIQEGNNMIALGDGHIFRINMENPEAPQNLDTILINDRILDVKTNKEWLYFALGDEGFGIYKMNGRPQKGKRNEVSGEKIITESAEEQILGPNQTQTFTTIGESSLEDEALAYSLDYKIFNTGNHVFNLEVFEDYLVTFSHFPHNPKSPIFEIFDITDPINPTLIAKAHDKEGEKYNSINRTKDLKIYKNYLITADFDVRNLHLFDISELQKNWIERLWEYFRQSDLSEWLKKHINQNRFLPAQE